MIRPLILGVAKVTFTHQYDSQIVHNNKKHITEVVKIPVSTRVSIETDKERVSAQSICSKMDHFQYEKGRKLALAKCFKKMSMTKDDRRRIWDEYNKLKTGGRW